MPRELQRALRFLRTVFARFRVDDGFRLAASLAYTTILSIVPVVAVALGIFTAFPGFDHVTLAVQEFFATQLLPKGVADKVLGYIDEFARNAGKLTAVGLAIIAVTAVVLVRTIERAFNQIWRVRRERPVVVRLLTYWTFVTLGPVVASVSVATTSYALSRWLGFVAGSPFASERVLDVAPWVLVALALAVLYVVMPNRTVRWRHALIGGFAAATAFEIVERGFGLYLAHAASYTTVYGTLAAVPIFLFWIYLSWVVVILGAEMVALLPDYAHASPAAVGGHAWRFADVLRVLAPLVAAQRAGRAIALPVLAGRARVITETAETVLERLAAAGWAARLPGDRWTLLCNVDTVTLGDVHARLLPTRDAIAPAEEDARVARLLAQVEHAVSGLATPLAALAQTAADAAPAREAGDGAPATGGGAGRSPAEARTAAAPPAAPGAGQPTESKFTT